MQSMIKLLQIVPVGGVRLFGQMVKKEIDLAKRGGTFYRSAAKERDCAKWSHCKYKGWIKLQRSVGEVVTAEVRSLSKSDDAWQLLHAFIGWLDRHFGEDIEALHIHCRNSDRTPGKKQAHVSKAGRGAFIRKNSKTAQEKILFCPMKGALGRGHRIPDGDRFLVLKGSTAVLQERGSAAKSPNSVSTRKLLIADGTLVERDDFYEFTSSFVFSSPSAAAQVIHGGPANGLTAWRNEDGQTLKTLDALPSK
jgi:hypothetical protein